MNKIFLLLFIFISSIASAQFGRFGMFGNQQFSVAFNSEQMIEKIGFDKLMQTIFDTKDKRNINGNTKAKMATVRKSLAAIYGAGIDFKRKVWLVTLESNANELEVVYNADPNIAFIVPIKNREVFEEAIKDIIDTDEPGTYQKSATTKGDVTYIANNGSILMMTKSDFIVTPIKSFYTYTYDNVPGKIIKQDTIIEEVKAVERNVFLDKEIAEGKKPLVEVDKWVNGKIIRSYTFKEPKSLVYDERNITIGAKDVMDTAIMATAPVTKDIIEHVPPPPTLDDFNTQKEAKLKKAIDTLIWYKYIDRNKSVKIYYIPYTEAEIKENENRKEEERKEKQTSYINSFVANYENILIYNNNKDEDIVKIRDCNDDIAMLSSMFMGNIVSPKASMMSYSLLTGKMPDADIFKSLSFVNFENGKAIGKFQAGCCTEASRKLNEMYLPTTNFWPKEMGNVNLGMMRYNLNVNSILNYYKQLLPKEGMVEFEAEMGKRNMNWDDFTKVLTGEIAMTLNTTKPRESGRKEPKVVFAMGVKDAKIAVEMMNTIASENLDMTQYYKFDETGKYILFNTDKISKNAIPAALPNVPTNLSMGHYGEMKFDIKGLINGLTRETDKKEADFQATRQFFSVVNSVNNKTEDGNFVSEITVDMGNKNTNALSNLVDLMEKIIKATNERRIAEVEVAMPDAVAKPKIITNRTSTKKTTTKKSPVKKE